MTSINRAIAIGLEILRARGAEVMIYLPTSKQLIKDRMTTLSKTVGDEAFLLRLIVASTTQVIATGDANAQGVVMLHGTIPADLASGDHTLVVVTGTTYAMMGIRVVPAALPTTGGSSERVIIIALFTLVFGALFFRGRRISLI